MSTVLQALEKARKDREKRRQETSRESAPARGYGGGDQKKPPPSAEVEGYQNPSRQSRRFLMLGIFFFIVGISALSASLYYVLKINDRISSIPISNNQQPGNHSINKSAAIQNSSPGDPNTPKTSGSNDIQDSAAGHIVQSQPTPRTEPTPAIRHVPVATMTSSPDDTIPEVVEPYELLKKESLKAMATPLSSPASTQAQPSSFSITDIRAEKLGLKVDGIFWDETKPMGIINGKIVGEGDSVEGLRIIKIQKKSLQVQKGAQHYNVLF